MIGLIDSHCHLNHDGMAELGTPESVMAAARAAGVAGALTICCKITQDSQDILDITQRIPNVWGTIGTHPHDAGADDEAAISLDDLIARAGGNPKIVGIGETGLDYYYDLSPRDQQQVSFRKHIRAAAALDLPLVIHARDADEDIVRILREEGAGSNPHVRGVMHCFSSTRWLAEQALAIGFYISFSGILTFKKSEELRAIARDVPLDRLMVETDSPYLAPEPLRGKTNQPAYILNTVRTLAQIKNMDEEGAIKLCNKNFFDLFTRAVPVV